MMKDSMLDELHKTVANTKNIAIAVNDELDLHARLLVRYYRVVPRFRNNRYFHQRKV